MSTVATANLVGITGNIAGDSGRKRVAVDTLTVDGDDARRIVHVLRPAVDEAAVLRRPSTHLTPRQLDVLRLLAEGRPAKEIAKQLWLSEATVRNHIRAILRELESHSQLEAVSKARRLGLAA